MDEYIKRRDVIGLIEDKLKRCETMPEAIVCARLRTAVMGLHSADVAPRAEWISVEERLPKNDWGNHWKDRKYYLVFTKPSGLMNVAVYGYKEHDWWIDRNSCVLDKKNYKEVTHWMPLPEPPKGEKHDPA